MPPVVGMLSQIETKAHSFRQNLGLARREVRAGQEPDGPRIAKAEAIVLAEGRKADEAYVVRDS